MNEIYIISGSGFDSDNNEPKFLAYDRGSGCYYWEKYLMRAKPFSSREDALNFIKTNTDFADCNKYSDGFSAPRLLDSTAELSNTRKEGRGSLRISKLRLQIDSTMYFEAKRGCFTAEDAFEIVY